MRCLLRQYDPMILNPNLLRLQHRGLCLQLTGGQYLMVAHMIRRPMILRTRAELLDVLDPTLQQELSDRAIDSRIKVLRRDARKVWGHSAWIKTVNGVGYFWDDTVDREANPTEVTGGPQTLRQRIFEIYRKDS